MKKITDFMRSTTIQTLGRKSIDKISEYLNQEVAQISIPTGAIHMSPNAPYAGKIKMFISNWANTLTTEEQKQIQQSLTDNFGVLILTIENLFTTSQTLAMTQYNVPTPGGNPIGSTPPFICPTWTSSIQSAIKEVVPEFSAAISTFIAQSYLTKGK